jgi:hypothetical protein
MPSKDLEDFFEDTPCAVGVVEIAETGEKFPVYLVDFGESHPSYTDALLHEQPFSLHTVRKQHDKYTYCVHGRSIMYLVGPQGAEATPQFSSAFDASEKDHTVFQKALKDLGAWMLIVKTSVNSHFVIDESGMVLQYYETPKENVRHL